MRISRIPFSNVVFTLSVVIDAIKVVHVAGLWTGLFSQ